VGKASGVAMSSTVIILQRATLASKSRMMPKQQLRRPEAEVDAGTRMRARAA